MATTIIKSGTSDYKAVVDNTGALKVTGGGGGGAVVVSGTVAISNTVPVSGTVNTNINGLNTFKTSQYTVGAAAVQLAPTPLTGRSSISIKVVTAANTDKVYIGNSVAVTSSTGYVLFNGDSVQLDITAAQVIYAIASATGQTVFVLEEGT